METKVLRIFITCLCVLVYACSPGRRDPEDVFSGGYDEADVIAVAQADGLPDMRFPCNQLVVTVAADAARDDMLEVFSRMGIEMIGQIPSAGIYQVRVNAADLVQLDAAKARLLALSQVESACYNVLFTQAADVGRCPVEPDVRLPEVTEPEMRPYTQTGYFIALEIIQGLRDLIPMSPVTVGIMDKGYNSLGGEFWNTEIANVSERGDRGERIHLIPDDDHGNAVAGLICADNNGSLVNGIASSFLGSRLRVVMARPAYGTYSAYLAALFQLGIEADIVNLGYFGGPFSDPALLPEFWAPMRRMISNFPWRLFVMPAPNVNVAVPDLNSLPPADLTLHNIIMVTAWSEDDPAVRHPGSGYGDGVDMAAPGRNIHVLNGMGGAAFSSGTSFAVPQVVSAAALLQSVGGSSLSPVEIRQLLLEATWSELVHAKGGTQLNYANALTDLLWQNYGRRSWARIILDRDNDGLCDLPVQIAETLCHEANVTIDTFGEFVFDPEDSCISGVPFFMSPDGTWWTFDLTGRGGPDMSYAHLQTNTSQRFALNEPYALGGPDSPVYLFMIAQSDPDHDCLFDMTGDGYSFRGDAQSGTFEFTGCRILERTPAGSARVLSVDVSFDALLHGTITYYVGGSILGEDMNTNASGWIRSVTVNILPPTGYFEYYIEELCSD